MPPHVARGLGTPAVTDRHIHKVRTYLDLLAQTNKFRTGFGYHCEKLYGYGLDLDLMPRIWIGFGFEIFISKHLWYFAVGFRYSFR